MAKVTRRNGGKIMASLIVLLGSLAYIMLLAIVNGLLGHLTALGVSLFGAFAVAKALGEAIPMSYGLLIGLAVGCGVVRGALRYFEQYSNHYIAFRLLATLRDKIFGALRVLCPAKLENKQKGNLIAMITSDIEALEVFYAHTISPICIAILVSLFVFLFVGFVSSWILAIVAAVGYITIGLILPPITSKLLKNSGVEYRKQFASFNAYFLDSIKGIKDIVLNNNEICREQEVDKRSGKLLEQTKITRHKSCVAGCITEALVSIFIALTLIVGITLVYTGNLSIGLMIVGVVAVFGSFGPVIAISNLPSNLTQTFAAGDRILDLLEEKPVVEEVTNGENIEYQNLDIDNLSFSYDNNIEVLKDIKLHAEKGEIIGIVGESGCGKSTLLKLLLRFFDRNSGLLNYNGIDIDNINTSNLLDNVTMVSQNTYLFDETIEENLRIAKQDATMEEIVDACKKASIHNFIMSLPEGYKTRVGALGDNLSAGEKQRLGLARAFLKGSELILLDEPTSNVDSINEGIILRSLAEQKSKKSIILVSHRESTMMLADRIYKMENGKMEETNCPSIA